jgi:hypothetical protein
LRTCDDVSVCSVKSVRFALDEEDGEQVVKTPGRSDRGALREREDPAGLIRTEKLKDDYDLRTQARQGGHKQHRRASASEFFSENDRSQAYDQRGYRESHDTKKWAAHDQRGSRDSHEQKAYHGDDRQSRMLRDYNAGTRLNFDSSLQGRFVHLCPDNRIATFSEQSCGNVRGRLATVVFSPPVDVRMGRVFQWTAEMRGRTMIGIVPEHGLPTFDKQESASVWAFVTRSSGCGFGLRRWGPSTLLCYRGGEVRLPPLRGRVTCKLDFGDKTLSFYDDGVLIEDAVIEDLELCSYRFAAAVGFDGSSVALI